MARIEIALPQRAVGTSEQKTPRKKVKPPVSRAYRVMFVQLVYALFQYVEGLEQKGIIDAMIVNQKIEGFLKNTIEVLMSKANPKSPCSISETQASTLVLSAKCLLPVQLQIDESIVKYLANGWTLEKLPYILLVVLRSGIFEVKFLKGLSIGLLVHHYIEIAKVFGLRKEIGFINSVIDKVSKEIAEA